MVKARRAIALMFVLMVTSASAAHLAACQLITGIREYDGDAGFPDGSLPSGGGGGGGDDGGGKEKPDTGVRCDHHSIPAISSAGSGNPTASPIYFALDSISFLPVAAGDGGAALVNGFDLDGICSGYQGGPTSETYGSSCAIGPKGMAVTDTAGGIDNSLQSLVTLVGGLVSADEFLPQNAHIASGTQTLLIQLAGYSGQDAANVQVNVVTSEYLEVTDDCDAGHAHLYDKSVDVGLPQPIPRRNGCDIWSVSSATARDLGSDVGLQPLTASYAASVKGNQLLAYFSKLQLPITGTAAVTLQEAVLVATIDTVPTDAGLPAYQQADGGASIYRLTNGTLAGRLGADNLLNTFRAAALTGKSGETYGICPGGGSDADEKYKQLKIVVCGLADINDPSVDSEGGITEAGAPVMLTPATDFTLPCNALSVGGQITATQIRGEGQLVDPTGKGVQDNCVNAPLDSCLGATPPFVDYDGAAPPDASNPDSGEADGGALDAGDASD